MAYFKYDIHGSALFVDDKVMVLDGTVRIATVIKENKKTIKIRFDDGIEKNIVSKQLKLQKWDENLNCYVNQDWD